MKKPAKITIGLFIVACAAIALWRLGAGSSGPWLQEAAEKERVEQRGDNAEICRLARHRLGLKNPDAAGSALSREQDEALVRVKCEPLGL